VAPLEAPAPGFASGHAELDAWLSRYALQATRAGSARVYLAFEGRVTVGYFALAAGEVDVAVHSYKDLPTAGLPGIVLAAVPERADPRDVLVARDQMVLGELPPGSVIGTGSPRRTAQLHALGLGLEVVGIRGNVETRIRKVTDGEVDGVVLARAGLARIGRAGEATEVLDPLQMLPAPGQGALVAECRADDVRTLELLASVDDAPTRVAVTAERAFLRGLGGGCQLPVAAHAQAPGDVTPSGKEAGAQDKSVSSEARIQTLEQQVSMLAEQVALLRGQLKVLADAKAPSDDSGAKLVLTSAPAPVSAVPSSSSGRTVSSKVASTARDASRKPAAMQRRKSLRRSWGRSRCRCRWRRRCH